VVGGGFGLFLNKLVRAEADGVGRDNAGFAGGPQGEGVSPE
jgi:hypothetical protein